jgi:hypothetical protein
VAGTISAPPNDGNPLLAVRSTYDQAGRLTKVETGRPTACQSEAVAPAAWTGSTAGAAYMALAARFPDGGGA